MTDSEKKEKEHTKTKKKSMHCTNWLSQAISLSPKKVLLLTFFQQYHEISGSYAVGLKIAAILDCF